MLMRQMPRYQCHKVVWALMIASIEYLPNPDASGKSAAASYGAIITPADEGFAPFEVSAEYMIKHMPHQGGYFVEYEGGYKSFSPKEVFESGYRAINPNSEKPAFVQRLIAEKEQLDSNLEKLRGFINGDVFDALEFEQRDLMREQLELMYCLSDCLGKRILLIEKDAA